MANIKFSQFTEKTTLGTVDFLVGYTGAENVQISPTNLLSTFVSGSGTNGQVAYFDPSNNLAGENDFFWDYTNNRLGIGTSSPSRTLHVKTDSGVLIKGASGSVNAKISLVPASGGRQYDLGNVGSDFRIFDSSAGVTRMYFDNDGNTGIGTTTPSSTLQISGTLDATGISQLGSGGSNVYLTSSSAGNVGIGTSGPTYKLHVVSSATPMAKFEGANNAYVDFTDPSSSVRLQNSGHSFFGTQTNTDLRFKTNATVKMSIQSGGNVGIGTTSPYGDLHLTGNSSQNIILTNTGADGNTGTTISRIIGQARGYGNNLSVMQSIDFETNSSAWYKGDIVFKTNNTDGTDPSVAATERMRIDSAGNVGIGTTSPDVKFEVVEASPTNGVVADFVNSTNTGGTTAAIKLSNADSDLCDVVLGANRVGGNFGSDFFISLSDGVDGSNQERLRITEDGNVGIGTTSPGQKLDVIGSIATNSIFLFDSSLNDRNVLDLDSSDNLQIGTGTSSGTRGITFITEGAERMRIDSSGDVGIGTLPRTAGNTWRSFYVGSSATIISRQTATGTDAMFNNNFYINSSNVDKRITTGGASRLFMNQDVIRFQRSATAATDTTISWSESMRITSSGNVGIGTTSPGQKLDVTGGGVKIQSDGYAAAGAYLELKHPNNNTTDICATINLTNNVGGYASIIGGTTGANNTGYIEFKTDNAGTQGTVLTLNGDSSATFAGDVDVTRSSTGQILSRIYNSNTSGTGTSVLRIANGGNQANGARLEFSDLNYYNAAVSVDRTNGMRFMVHDDSTSMSDLLTHPVLTLATNKNATFAGDIILQNATPKISIIDTDAGDSFSVNNFTGNFVIKNDTDNTDPLIIDGANNATFAGDVNIGDDLNITGNQLTFTNDAASAYIRGADSLLIQSDWNTGENKPIYLQPSAVTELTIATGLSTFAGDVEIANSSNGIILESPDGTRYRVTVANGGTLSVSAV